MCPIHLAQTFERGTVYNIVRFYQNSTIESKVIKGGLTLAEAQAHCQDPDTSSRTCTSKDGTEHTYLYGAWFDGYEESR